MSRRSPDEVPAAFHDASACFSEEEWKLLQDWQKELCRNLMKEIHQALISLGPLIATTVSSLRAKDRDEVCHMENQDFGSKHRRNQPPDLPLFEADNCSWKGEPQKEEPVSFSIDYLGAELRDGDAEPDHGYEVVSFCVKGEEEASGGKNPGSRRIKRTRSPMSPLIATTVSSLRANDRDELCHMEKEECERKHRINQLSNLPLFEADNCSWKGEPQKEEPVSFSIDYLGAELRDGDAEPDHGYEVVSFCVKGEEEALGGKNPGSHRIKHTRSPMSTVLPQYKQGVRRKVVDTVQNLEPGDQRMTRKKKDEDALKYSAKRRPHKAASERINMMVFPSCDKEAQLRNLLWAETFPESIEETTSHCERSLSYPGHVNIHQGTGGSDPGTGRSEQGTGGSEQGTGGSEQYINCNSNLQNSPLCKDLEIIEQDQKTYISSTDKNPCVKGDLKKQLKAHSRERRFACPECKKRFFQKTRLIVHCRVHSGEKPYVCTFCHKRFNRKDYLSEHIRIHTGERPYKCTECEKSFIQKSHLVYHQRKHTENFKNSILRD
ncbi:uncharacterized protein LOC144782514 [Lissotriton helveticus]